MRGHRDDLHPGDGNHAAVVFAGSQGVFELNAMRPIVINKMPPTRHASLPTDARSFACSVQGTALNQKRIAEFVSRIRCMPTIS